MVATAPNVATHRPEVSLQTVRDALVVAGITAVPVLLILLQPDFGSASVFLAIATGMSLWGGMDLLLLFLLVSLPFAMLLSLLGDVAVMHVLKPHQKQRIDAFLDPYVDPYGSGYHVIQSMIAVGSGGIWGKGFLEGTQTQLRYIPKQWTDFIFCVPAEEFGFVGGVALLGIYGFLFWQLLRLVRKTRSVFEAMVVVGVLSLWFYHVMVNIGMALGWVDWC